MNPKVHTRAWRVFKPTFHTRTCSAAELGSDAQHGDISPHSITMFPQNFSALLKLQTLIYSLIICVYRIDPDAMAASLLTQNLGETEIETQVSYAASSSTSSNYGYDVFINHRGPDVKKTFASHLYHRLVLHGFRVFLDKRELQEGENLTSQIESAIKTASVHLAIFSRRYAESNWCLNELLQMLSSRAPIIPVFYDVKPDELRWTQSKNRVYGQALHNLQSKKKYDSETHEEKPRYDSITIEKWREALSLVADLSGFELEACNGDEGELVEKVVQRLLKKVKRTRFSVAEYPTGLEEKLKDFENTVLLLQQQQSGKPQVVGIVGMGGMGKTTLAQELFNRKSSDYRRSYFLSDVRENASKSSLHSLQRKLLKGLTQIDRQIESVSEGKEMLKGYLSSSHALIILDDVDHLNQLDALLRPIQTVLGSDSLILITSRDKDVLTCSGVKESSVYKLTGLNTPHSRELFCLHAFSQSDPLPGFEYLVDKFLKVCDGLPLSLKVFGARFCGKIDKSYWQDQLDILQQIQVPAEIQHRLKISYDSLNKEEQEMFLDIACFLIGENRDMAIRIWDGSGWKGLLGFQNLQNKCLVEVDSENDIHMHDHLRDLGKDIAKASRLPRRLWRREENVDDLLQQSINEQVTTEVRGIRMLPNVYNDGSKHASLRSGMSLYKRSRQVFSNSLVKFLHNTRFHGVGTRGLQLLDIEGGHLERILERVQSPNLIWLRWRGCPDSSLPPWIPMKDLRVLQVHGRVLKTLWHGKSQVPLQLRELQIQSPLSKFPKSIGKLKHLQVVTCDGDDNLEKLPEEFCYLRSLKVLVLTKFSKMKSLPQSFGVLTNLEHINLSDSHNLQSLPNSFGNLTRLKYLDFHCCHNLTVSSETLGDIRRLEYINLSYCVNIEELPSQVTHQRSLEQLVLEGTRLKALPSAIGDLNDLEVLEFGSPLPETLPLSLGHLKNLKILTLKYCRQLKCLPESVGLMTQLTNLTVEVCPLLKCLPESVGLMAPLTKLTVIRCPLRKLPFIKVEGERETLTESRKGVCPNLQCLIFDHCNDLLEVGTLPNTLTELDLTGSKLKKLDGLCGLAKLQMLNIRWCREVEELPSIETLVSLKELWASHCVKLKSIRGLRQLTKLRLLHVYECHEIEELEGVEHCISLVKVDARGCPKLQWGEGVVEQLRQQMNEGLQCGEGVMEHQRQQINEGLQCGEGVMEQLRQQFKVT